MEIKRSPIPRMTIEEFADEHGLVMEVVERGARWENTNEQYYAHFSDCDIKDGGCLVGAFGNGSTEHEAIKAYAARISEQRIVINAFSDDRREIAVPRLI